MRKLFILQSFLALLISIGSCAQQTTGVKVLSAPAFAQALDSIHQKQVVDVRTPEEYQSGHIAMAENINLYDADFTSKLNQLDKQQPVFVYCKVGGRSAKAAKALHDLGFTRVYDLDGGIMAWEKNKLPLQLASKNKADANSFTQADFERLLSGNKLLLVDFHAPWCIPCKQMAPYLKKLEDEYKGRVTVSRIDIDHAKALAQQLNVESIPVIAVYKNGKELKRVNGLQTEAQIRDLIAFLMK